MGLGTHAGCTACCNGFTKLLLGQAFGSFLVELGMVKKGQEVKKSHWAAEGRKKKTKIAREDELATTKIARENEPATVGRPDGDEARSGNLRRLGREDEPPTKKRSREYEPDPPRDDGLVGPKAVCRNHFPEGCFYGRIMMAIGASLVAEISGMETIDMTVVLGGLFMAIGAAVVARWTVKAA